MRSIAILDCNAHSQITVAHVTLPKAVPSTVKIFAVYPLSSIYLLQYQDFQLCSLVAEETAKQPNANVVGLKKILLLSQICTF